MCACLCVCFVICLFVCLFVCDGRRWRANSAAPTASSQTTSCASAAATRLLYGLHCCARATCRVAWHAPPVRLHYRVCDTCPVALACGTCPVALAHATCPVAMARATCHVALMRATCPAALPGARREGLYDTALRLVASSGIDVRLLAPAKWDQPLALAKWDCPHSC